MAASPPKWRSSPELSECPASAKSLQIWPRRPRRRVGPLELTVKVSPKKSPAYETHGGENRICAARFPQAKTLDNVRLRPPTIHFTSPDLPSPPTRPVPRNPQRDLPRPSRNWQYTPSIASESTPARRGYRVTFATATQWVIRLSESKNRAGSPINSTG